MTKPEQFEQYGCVLVEGFLDPLTIKTISMYMENKIRRNEWQKNEEDGTTELAYYGDPLIETVLQTSLPLVAETCGKELDPTYSYMRIYQPGEELGPHIDRRSCEISVTVNVASKGTPSPIWMHYKDKEPHAYTLNPGDAVVYKGCEAKHWRKPFEADQLNVQFMLHYVDKNGPYAERKFDTRPNLGFSDTTRRS
jgi:alkylated DNA repair dioxygenase AlkB